jgi:SPP1 gp7 family putative phage head morphogenesis protein
MAGYVSKLSGVINAMHSEALAALRTEGVRTDAADGDAPLPAGASGRVTARLQRLAKQIVGDKKLIASVEGVGANVFRFSREQWSRQVKASLGIDLTEDPKLDALAKGFRAENTKLIKSLCAEHVERVRDVLADAGSGERVETIMRGIREATGASKSRAALIARDQVLSLNSDVAQARHEALGVTEYVWRTSKDERVRAAHKALDGKRFKYSDPPVVDPRTGRREAPGRDFQCRCTAEPIIPGIDD